METTDIKILLVGRTEAWRKAQQALVVLGNETQEPDIQARIYEWSDEALARKKECDAITSIIAKAKQ